MRQIVFAKTRYHYDSYIDFWRLVEASEFPTCHVDEIDLADDTKTFIFTPMNGEGMEKLANWKARRAKIIWWNLERPSDETLPKSLEAIHGAVDAVWVSDRSYAALDARLTYVQVAGHRKFGALSGERLYDVCHLSYLWGRRSDAINTLMQRGVRIAPEAWGKGRQDEVVAKSHLMLSLHQYADMRILAPIRFAVAASYAIPIVSEPYTDPKAAFLAFQAPFANLPDVIERLLKNPDHLRRIGADLYRQLCADTNFRIEVERAVMT